MSCCTGEALWTPNVFRLDDDKRRVQERHYKWELEEEQCVGRGTEPMSYGFRENVKTLGAS